jgi:hypothetical protein
MKSITFIVGAGASMPYGFPSGTELVCEIVNVLTNNNHLINEINNLFQKNYQTDAPIAMFCKDLTRSNTPSIDLFLANQKLYYTIIGKISIAFIIYTLNNAITLANITSPFVNASEDWYKLLFHKIIDSIELGNNINFINFNYDTSLENYLFSSAIHFYGDHKLKCKSFMNSIKISHVYGSISGTHYRNNLVFKKEDLQTKDSLYSLLTKDLSIDLPTLIRLADNIKIINEKNFDDEKLKNIRDTLNNSDKIYCTGFSYNKTNCKIIGLNAEYMKVNNQYFKGNAYGLGKAEKEVISEYIGNREFLTNESYLNHIKYMKEYVNLN